MDRREFLTWLGVSTIVIGTKAPFDSAKPFSYEKLHFTGFKRAISQDSAAGQFLWKVAYETPSGEYGETFWFCNVAVSGQDVYGHRGKQAYRLIESKLQNGVMAVADMCDGIARDAAMGLVQTGQFYQIPNPDFNPALEATSAYEDDEDYVYNPRTINGPPIMRTAKKVWIEPFDESYPEWDLRNETVMACVALRLTGKEVQSERQ